MFERTTFNKTIRAGRTFGLACAACSLFGAATLAQSSMDEPDFEDLFDDESMEMEDTELAGDGEVSVSSFLTVEIHVQDTDLADVLQMLSIQSRKNIIVSRNVSASVTADLYDVTFYEALDAILNANGYGYREEGNFIYIYTLEELRTLEESEREAESTVFHLSYLNAQDAAVFVTPLLSDDGTIAINGEVAAGIDPSTDDVGASTWANSATLVVSDYRENLDAIQQLIADLDTRPQQVLVEATVLQTKLDEANALGVDYSVVADVDFDDFTNPLSGVSDLLNGSEDGYQPPDNNAMVGTSSIGRVSGPGTLKVGVISDDISVFLRVLDEVSETTVLSRPKVLALNRQRGEILIGAQIGYLSTTATETSTTQTVEFLDTGTKLLFRPFVASDGHIRMELAPSVSEGIIREITTAAGDSVTIPDRITQELTTNVVVRDGHTIVLGGLFREQTDISRRQVPVLGDIPLVGNAFKGREDSTARQEIIFLITPTIMKDEFLDELGSEGVASVRRAQLGARKGVLIWSNDRLTAQHAMRAEELFRAGESEKALWEVQRSLSLRPNQPQVIHLRERITGEQDHAFQRALLTPLVESAAQAHMQTSVQAETDSEFDREMLDTSDLAPEDQSLTSLEADSTETDTEPAGETTSDEIATEQASDINEAEIAETASPEATEDEGPIASADQQGESEKEFDPSEFIAEAEESTQTEALAQSDQTSQNGAEFVPNEETSQSSNFTQGRQYPTTETDTASTIDVRDTLMDEAVAERLTMRESEKAADVTDESSESTGANDESEWKQFEQPADEASFDQVPHQLALSGQVPNQENGPFTLTFMWQRVQSMLYIDPTAIESETQLVDVDPEVEEDLSK